MKKYNILLGGEHSSSWKNMTDESTRHRATAMFTLAGVAAFPLGDCGERLAYSGRPRESGGWSR